MQRVKLDPRKVPAATKISKKKMITVLSYPVVTLEALVLVANYTESVNNLALAVIATPLTFYLGVFLYTVGYTMFMTEDALKPRVVVTIWFIGGCILVAGLFLCMLAPFTPWLLW